MARLTCFPAASLLLCLAVVFADSHSDKPTRSSISLSTSSFGASLYKSLVSDNQDNIIFSPFSAYTTLAMLYLGASGDTKQELRAALAIQRRQNVHRDLQTILNSLTTDDPDANVTLRIANALYYDPAQVEILDSYASNITEYYGAGPQAFQTQNPEQSINTWVEEVTKGEITNFLLPGDITPDTLLMLLNAVFFEASWRTMFDPQYTEDANFTTISGAVTQVPTMVVQSTFSVKDVEDLEARVLELPYRGGNYSLYVILPNAQNGLTEMESKLNGRILERAVKRMPPAQLYRVYLPKFTLRLRKNLNEFLQTLGLGSMFDSQRANFSDMVVDAAGVVVSDVLHEALIEVTESGTKAAAVTSVGIIPTSIVLPQLFRVDRPFVFLLRDKVNELNIFMGRVTDPPQNSTSNA